jgi:hypothetical protein
MRSYGGNAFHTLHLVIGGSSPLQDVVLEGCKSLLRRYSFDRFPRASLRIVRRNAGGTAAHVDRNLRAAVDGLLEALSENPNPNDGLVIEVDVAPSPRVFKSLAESPWGLRANEDEGPGEASTLRIHNSQEAGAEFCVDVHYRDGDGSPERRVRVTTAVLARDNGRGAIHEALDSVLPCAMALRQPEYVNFGLSSQEMMETLMFDWLPRYFNDGSSFNLVSFGKGSREDIFVRPALYRSLVRIPGLTRLMMTGFVLEGLHGDNGVAENAGFDDGADEPLELRLLRCTIGRGAPNVLSPRPLGEIFVVRRPAAEEGGNNGAQAAHRPPNLIDDLVRGVCARHGDTLSRLCLFDSPLSGGEVSGLCALLRDTASCRVRHLCLGQSGAAGQGNVLSDARASEFFNSLPSFPSTLRALSFCHEVRTRALASRVLAGVRSNVALTSLNGLDFGTDRQAEREVDFWVMSNAKGRALVEAFVRSSVRGGLGDQVGVGGGGDGRGGDQDGVAAAVAPPAGLMAHVLRGCLQSSVRMDPEDTAEDPEMHVPVLYHFVRRLAPATLARAP